MVIHDCNLGLSHNQVQEAFAMSQMTVISESEEKSWAKYEGCIYVEFLEVIARVADTMFRETEMEGERLAWKLEQVLDMLFQRIL